MVTMHRAKRNSSRIMAYAESVQAKNPTKNTLRVQTAPTRINYSVLPAKRPVAWNNPEPIIQSCTSQGTMQAMSLQPEAGGVVAEAAAEAEVETEAGAAVIKVNGQMAIAIPAKISKVTPANGSPSSSNRDPLWYPYQVTK